MSSMYEYLILVSDNSDITLKDVYDKLEAFYEKDERQVKISFTSNNIHIKVENFAFYVSWNEEEYVLEESQEMEEFAIKNKEMIKACKRRIEMSDTGNDPDTNYFNDSLYIMEILESFKDVYVFNPHEGTFMDDY